MNLQEQKSKALKFFDACQMVGMKCLTAENIPALLDCIGLNQPEQPELKLEAPVAPVETAPAAKTDETPICHIYNSKAGIKGMVHDLEKFCEARKVSQCRDIYHRFEGDPLERSLQKASANAFNHGYKMSGEYSIFRLSRFYNRAKKTDKPDWVN